MNWDEILKEFDIDIPEEQPVFPINVVCDMLHMQYHLLHEILKEGIISAPQKKQNKKLLSVRDVQKLKYVQYLIEEKGVNLNGVKVILEMTIKEE
jgi:MerR family transcriptional regulator/heat shock protein HspR